MGGSRDKNTFTGRGVMGKNLVTGGVMQLSNDTSKNSTSPPLTRKK